MAAVFLFRCSSPGTRLWRWSATFRLGAFALTATAWDFHTTFTPKRGNLNCADLWRSQGWRHRLARVGASLQPVVNFIFDISDAARAKIYRLREKSSFLHPTQVFVAVANTHFGFQAISRNDAHSELRDDEHGPL
jgi:hypothetical protein